MINEKCLKKWCLILNDVKETQDTKISCWYSDFKGAFHGFSDASVSGYSHCIYI